MSSPRVRLVAGGYSDAPAGKRALGAFREALNRCGLIDGHDYTLEFVFAEGRVDAFDDLMLRDTEDVAVLVPLDSRALVPVNRPGTAGEGPLVVTTFTSEPVLRGIAHTVDEPGGKINGLTVPTNALTWTRFQLLSEAVPHAKRVGVLRFLGQRGAIGDEVRRRELGAALEAARAFGMEIVADLGIKGNPATGDHLQEINQVFGRIEREDIDALIVLQIPTLNHNLFMLEHRVKSLKVPSMFSYKEFAESGALMAYGPDGMTMVRQAASYVARILRCPPAERREMVKRMPLEEPRRYHLALNLGTARRLGMEPSWGLINLAASADLLMES